MRFARAITPVAFAVLASCAGIARADRAEEITQIHLAAIGGADRVAALRAYRASGRLLVGEQSARLVVTAARPDRLRVEMQYPERTVVQGYDGVRPPWQAETIAGRSEARPQARAMAAEFKASAEFDDPLVGARAYGCTVDFAGETKVEEKSFLQLLVVQRLTRSFILLVDPETYFIVMRIDEAAAESGGRGRVITRYEDFRPVAGVLLAHTVTVVVDQQPPRRAVFDVMEPNPALPPATFVTPTP